MGDRAILDGILSVLSQIDPMCQIKIGSLFEFFSERTLLEEKTVFRNTAPNVKLYIFDIKNTEIRNKEIMQSDILLVGGGPLMHIDELILLQKSLEYAKKRDIPSVVMGCGLGPLNRTWHIKVVEQILSAASKISFRDKLSAAFAKQLYGSKFQTECLGDPAIISIEDYKRLHNKKKEGYIAVNFREYSPFAYGNIEQDAFERELELLMKIQQRTQKIVLVPMHTFAIGGDDRYYLSKLAFELPDAHFEILHSPLDLHQLYRIYFEAYACVGMRYHAVVMQSILNGNNLIFDYTDGLTGKIQGFLEVADRQGFYLNRTYQLKSRKQRSIDGLLKEIDKKEHFLYQYSDMKSEYVSFIKEVI